MKDNCNVLGISILYNGEIEGFECGFPCFLPEYDAVFHALSLLPTRRHTAFGINLSAKLANYPQTRHFSSKIYTNLCEIVSDFIFFVHSD